jgi:perosamine synthetase
MVQAKSAIKAIPIAKSYFDGLELKLVSDVIRSGWIAQGKMVEEFESKVAAYAGASHAVALSSGTAALHLALLIAGVKPGDEVIIPSFSFIATANAVLYCGAKPVFIDIDPRTYNIDPDKIKAALTKKTRAIMPVHQFGLACDIDEIRRIADKHALPVVEDAACALGAGYKAKMIGSGGNMACFSFHPRKILTTGEGGMLVTNDASQAEKARVLRNHGMKMTAIAKDAMKKTPPEDYEALGFNYRLTDVQAAIGIAQMARLAEILEKRLYLASRYNNAFKNTAFLETPYIPAYATPNYQSYILRIRNSSKVRRDEIVDLLREDDIYARRGNTAIHMQALYKNMKVRLPHTEEAARDTIAIPLYYTMTDKEQDLVINKVLRAIGG